MLMEINLIKATCIKEMQIDQSFNPQGPIHFYSQYPVGSIMYFSNK